MHRPDATHMTFVLVLAVLLLLGAAEAPAEGGDAEIEIREWEVPWEETRPRDPYVAPDGRIWFVGQRAHYAAVFDPETEEFQRYDLPDGAGPHTVVVDGEGRPWYAGNRAAHIGLIDPETGEITLFPTPEPEGRDPHTMTFTGDGAIWFTAQGGNSIGRFDPATGDVEVLPVSVDRARPYGLVTGPDDTVWAVLFGTNRLARVDPGKRALEEIELPRAETRPRRLGVTSRGAVWYVDYAGGFLGHYDPATGQVREWPAPAGEASRPYAVTVDDRDRVWFVETGPDPNRLVGFDPDSGEYVAVVEIPSGAGAVRHMVFDPRERVIWFGTDANTLGRAAVP